MLKREESIVDGRGGCCDVLLGSSIFENSFRFWFLGFLVGSLIRSVGRRVAVLVHRSDILEESNIASLVLPEGYGFRLELRSSPAPRVRFLAIQHRGCHSESWICKSGFRVEDIRFHL